MKNGTTPRGAPEQPAQENGAASGTPSGQTEKVKKPKYVKKGGNGGRRVGSGRKTTIETLEKLDVAEEMKNHLHEEVMMIIREPGQQPRTEKRKTFRALLDKLRDKGIKGDGDVMAIREYFDRTLGKAPQSVAMKHSGEVGTYTAKRPSKAALAAKRAYANELRKGNR